VRLARVRTEDDTVWLARVQPEAVELLRRQSTHPAADALREALADGLDVDAPRVVRTVAPSTATLLSPVANPSKTLGVGLNYATHAAESLMAVRTVPSMFVKTNNSIVGPDMDTVVDSRLTQQPDYGVELEVVIGRPAYRVEDDPLDYVLGYTICNDVTARDIQFAHGQ
jgi:2-keto-4-pentenoate hydratase/2-oxohepta-3-ene-1,7-dioic acid hydratase in catechol pathway